MSCSAPRRFRRLHALLLCTLWLAGFELGPGLHVVLHEAIGHHHHGSAGHRVVEAESAHEPEEHGHGHGHEHEDHEAHEAPELLQVLDGDHDLRIVEAVARCADDLHHGAHTLAHRGVAALPTPPAWPPVVVASWTPLTRAHRSLDVLRSRTPRCVRARGPPV